MVRPVGILAGLLAGTAILFAAPKQITIVDAALHQYEDGPSLPGSHVFVQGETVYVSANFGQYTPTEAEENQRVLLSWEIDVLDPAGVLTVPTKKDKVDARLAPQDKDWLPKIRYDFLLPPLAGSGDYKVVIRVKDENSGTSATAELPLRVKGHDVEPSDTLVVRNFRWLRSEQDTTPVTTAAYRPGDSVWARFDITGYQFAEGNRFDVAYGLEVFRPSGSTVYAEPNAAQQSEASFYPKHYMPGVLNLNLTPDISKGDYTIVLTVEDRIGGQKDVTRHVFHIE